MASILLGTLFMSFTVVYTMSPYSYIEPRGVALFYIRGHFTSRALRSKQLSECPRLQLGGERVGIQIQFWCLKFLIILGPIFPLERGRPIMVEVETQSGEGDGNSLQYSCLEKPMDGGAWWATVHGVAKSQTRLSGFTFTHWRRKWQPTPVFLPGESQGRGSLVGCHLWGHTESDTTEAT